MHSGIGGPLRYHDGTARRRLAAPIAAVHPTEDAGSWARFEVASCRATSRTPSAYLSGMTRVGPRRVGARQAAPLLRHRLLLEGRGMPRPCCFAVLARRGVGVGTTFSVSPSAVITRSTVLHSGFPVAESAL